MFSTFTKLDKELLELHNSYSHLQEEYNDLKGKLHFFNKVYSFWCIIMYYEAWQIKSYIGSQYDFYRKDNDLNLGELEEALALIYRRKEDALQSQLSSSSGEYENIDVLKQKLLKVHVKFYDKKFFLLFNKLCYLNILFVIFRLKPSMLKR